MTAAAQKLVAGPATQVAAVLGLGSAGAQELRTVAAEAQQVAAKQLKHRNSKEPRPGGDQEVQKLKLARG